MTVDDPINFLLKKVVQSYSLCIPCLVLQNNKKKKCKKYWENLATYSAIGSATIEILPVGLAYAMLPSSVVSPK